MIFLIFLLIIVFIIKLYQLFTFESFDGNCIKPFMPEFENKNNIFNKYIYKILKNDDSSKEISLNDLSGYIILEDGVSLNDISMDIDMDNNSSRINETEFILFMNNYKINDKIKDICYNDISYSDISDEIDDLRSQDFINTTMDISNYMQDPVSSDYKYYDNANCKLSYLNFN